MITDRARQRLLLIDDDEAFMRSFVRSLSRHHDVTTAMGGVEGVAILLGKDADFDVVLCDVMMPSCTGVDVHRDVAAVSQALAARIVFMTGGATTSEVKSFLAKVPNLVLEKPFSTQQLMSVIDERRGSATPR